MRNLIARAQQMCAFVLVLVASSASAQDVQHTAKVVHPQGVYRIGVDVHVRAVGGQVIGDQVSLGQKGVLNVIWLSREFSCVGREVPPDLRARFTVPPQAELSCHPYKGVSPNHANGIQGVRARMVSFVKSKKDGKEILTQVLFNGSYAFTYTGSTT